MKSLIISSLLILLISSCNKTSNGNSDQKTQQKDKGWLPPPAYKPKNQKASMLSDSAAVLQVRAQQDPTLDDFERQKLINQAFSMLTEALKLDPDYGMAMSNLSAVYLEKDDTLKALELMRRRLKVEPELAEGWQAVGIFSDLSGDSAEAKICYQKSIEIYDGRLKMGKKYSKPENLMFYYDNWSGKAFSLLMSGDTKNAHNSIRVLLEEAAPILGQNTDTYAAMLTKDRWILLKEMKGN
jgi:tetratricopeptide (TPR) repeat protein